MGGAVARPVAARRPAAAAGAERNRRRCRRGLVAAEVEPNAARQDRLLEPRDHREDLRLAKRPCQGTEAIIRPHDVRGERLLEDVGPVEEEREPVGDVVAGGQIEARRRVRAALQRVEEPTVVALGKVAFRIFAAPIVRQPHGERAALVHARQVVGPVRDVRQRPVNDDPRDLRIRAEIREQQEIGLRIDVGDVRVHAERACPCRQEVPVEEGPNLPFDAVDLGFPRVDRAGDQQGCASGRVRLRELECLVRDEALDVAMEGRDRREACA